MPYFELPKAINVLEKVQGREFPQRPSDKIPDTVWELLEKCWDWEPTNRPSTAQVCNAFSQFRSVP